MEHLCCKLSVVASSAMESPSFAYFAYGQLLLNSDSGFISVVNVFDLLFL